MSSEYEFLVRYTATGADGEQQIESQWVVEVEKDSTDDAKMRFLEIIDDVSYWSFDITSVEEKKD